MRTDVGVIGCGVIGAAIAYRLARQGLSVVVIDAAEPTSGSTGAALGILYGVSSQQVTGSAVELRLLSGTRFDPLIADLEQDLGRPVPVNRRGILRLLEAEDWQGWSETITARQEAGYRLEPLDPQQVAELQPGLRSDHAGGLYSPEDRQVEPRHLTQALIQGARAHGAQFFFHQPVTGFKSVNDRINAVYTQTQTISAGMVVVAAGLGSTALGLLLDLPIPIRPVKGQALQVYTPEISLGPVISDHDLHLAPLCDGTIWIGATVEFDPPTPQPTLTGFQALISQALQVCPGLANAEIRSTWSGQRPRPSGQRAPILGLSPHHRNLVIATGHYRNGVLLAPITADIVMDLINTGQTSICDITPFAPHASGSISDRA